MIAFKLISRTIPSTEQMAEVYHVPSVCVQQAEYDCVEALDGDFYPSTVLDFIWYYFGEHPVLHQVPRTEMVVVPGRRVAGVRARGEGPVVPRVDAGRLPFECTSVGATSREVEGFVRPGVSLRRERGV